MEFKIFSKGFLFGLWLGFFLIIVLAVNLPRLTIVFLLVWLLLPVCFLIKNAGSVMFVRGSRKWLFWLTIVTTNFSSLIISAILFSPVRKKSELSDILQYTFNGKGSFNDIVLTAFVGERKIDANLLVIIILFFVLLMSMFNYHIMNERNDINYKTTKDILSFILTFTAAVFTFTSLAQLTLDKNIFVTDGLLILQGAVLSVTMSLFPIFGATCVLVNKK